ncbi:MAG: nucleotidyl transferase AbiEii/AbiGii toxin family protein [Candidatus Adiutrix sp.]
MFIQPKLDILPEAQKQLWPQLRDTPAEFVLYGGTAIALRYGHRQSVDFDFFTTAPLDVKASSCELPFIKNYPHDMTLRTNQQVDYTVQLGEKTVNVTFMSNKTVMPGAINSPDKALDTGIKIASPLDLMACKIMTMHNRSEQKDFIDLGELIKNRVNLQKGFEGSVALARLTPQGTGMLNLSYLKADLQAKTLKNMLPDRPEYVEIIREAASQIDVNKAMKTAMKANKNNFKCIGIAR